MNLLTETFTFLGWALKMVRAFFKVRPFTTLFLIITILSSEITRLLAFLLPLKIILMVGSEGVPRYFRFFLTEPDHKPYWIIGLSIGAIFFYIATLVLEALSNRLAQSGSADIHQRANEILVLTNQESQARDCYEKICTLCADLIFALMFFLLGVAVINTLLFTCVAAMVVALFFFTAWALRGPENVNPGRLKSFVQDKVKNYLNILSSIIFLSSFLVLLYPFATGQGGNILFAIISILLLRRLLSAAVSAASSATGLTKNKHTINMLVLREFQLEKPEAKVSQTLRDLFNKEMRQRRVPEELEKVSIHVQDADVCWQDSSIGGVHSFAITGHDREENQTRHFLQLVFGPKSIHFLKNEAFLFQHISRERLKAPNPLTRYSEGDFECVMYDRGQGPSPELNWKEWEKRLFLGAWCCQPPEGLIKAYLASKNLLGKRLTDELVSRASIAMDTEHERATLAAFQAQVGTIRTWINELPLYIHNPDCIQSNVVPAKKGEDVLVMIWARWTLEPLGAFPLKGAEDAEVSNAIAMLQEARTDVPDSLTPAQLRLATDCRALEGELVRGAYKAALGTMARILKSPLFNLPVHRVDVPASKDAA